VTGRRLAALCLLAGGAIWAEAQVRPPTFEVGIEVINLNLSVTDARNHYVTDLKASDFAVFEDGIRQELSLFTHENLPISMAVLIDASASMDEKIQAAQSAAVRFVKTLREEDAAQIVEFNDRATVLQDFTNNQTALETAIRKTKAAGPTALHNALYIALKDLGKEKKAGQLRRLAVILLTDGEDTASLVTDEQVLDLARKTEINIYCIRLGGERAQDRLRPNFSQAGYVLTALARETGGQVFFPASISELDSVYDRIAEELRTQYSVGYVSSNRKTDGKWRRIVVRVPEREGIQVRHKLGYFGPANRPAG
jgi:Ca-activated chloride channel family protein